MFTRKFSQVLIVMFMFVFGEAVLFGADSSKTPRWLAMDYGPFLTASVEAPGTNIANKGIAIRLADAFGGHLGEAVVFDTDLLRFSVGWTGEFLNLLGVVYDGSHGTHPLIQGTQQWANAVGPGWSLTAEVTDPRDISWGPLPRNWARWNGLFLHGKKVILSYNVFGTGVIEMPALETAPGITAFARTIEIGASSSNLFLQVFGFSNLAAQPIGDANASTRRPAKTSALFLDSLAPGEITVAPDQLLVAAGTADRTTSAGVVGEIAGGARRISDTGEVRLMVPPATSPRRLKVLVWSGTESSLPQFASLVRKADAPLDLRVLTRGGPPRWPEQLSTRSKPGPGSGPFATDLMTWPEDNPWHSWLRFGGFDFFSDASQAAVCTWNGDVWRVSGIRSAPKPGQVTGKERSRRAAETSALPGTASSLEKANSGELDQRSSDVQQLTWQRIATGLFQPLGLEIVDDKIYVLGRDQITILHDLNGDGEADYYENFNNDHQVTTHFHEFAMDLQRDANGDFYYMKAARHALTPLVPQHGTLLKLARDGSRTEIVANGFRAPNGLCIATDGTYFSSDQEGHWIPANRLNRIEPGGFYGNRWSFLRPGDLERYQEPLCWVHRSVDRSPSTFVRVESQQWGPLRDELLSLSYGTGEIFLMLKEHVDGAWQGGITPLPIEFPTGVMRGRFHPQDGHLYVCGLYGWAGNKTIPGGFYRIRTTGKQIVMPIELHAVKDGVVLGFTTPLDRETAADVENYSAKRWNYKMSEQYGSPDFKLSGEKGQELVEIKSATISKNGRRVFLEIPPICPVMQMHIQMELQSADGTPISTYVHHTIHKLGTQSGQELVR